jgi:hypothetical protein
MDFSAADLVVTSLLDVGLETLAGVMEAPSPSRAP